MASAGHDKSFGYIIPCCALATAGDASPPSSQQQQQQTRRPRCVFCCSRAGDALELEQRLIQQSDLVSCSDRCGRHPLHLAASRGHAVAVELLLRFGANVDARDQAKETALTLAGRWSERKFERDVLDTVVVLVQHGADLNAQQSDGHTALHVCVAGGYAKAVSQLLASGADGAVENAYGETPVCIALRKLVNNDKAVATGINATMVRMLLQHGVPATQDKRLYVLLGNALSAAALCQPWQPHSSRDAVSLLNEHGYVLTEQEHARQLLRTRCSVQREGILPLAAMCRRVIRRCLERAIPAKCQNLPIPPSIQRYIITGCQLRLTGDVAA